MVNFVDVLIERAPMKCPMGPVMPGIFNHEEYSNLIEDGENRGKRYTGGKAKILGQGVEKPN